MRRLVSRVLLFAAFAVAGVVSRELTADDLVPAEVRVWPESLRLIHRRQPHSLIVHGRTADGLSVDLGSQAQITSRDPSIASVEQGWVQPHANGETTLVVQAAGQTREVPVKVALPKTERPWSFKQEVMPVLSKAGCNMGACHGYSLGKGGFSLSLRGANAAQDYQAIFGDAFSRRINRLSPEDSLLLRKPLGEVPHRGGVRFSRSSPLHQILAGWIEQGAPSDVQDQTEVDHVRIFPAKLVIEPGQPHTLQLIAHLTDGTTRDVTRLATFTVNTEGVADVDDQGRVLARDLGESAIVARFERKFAATRLIVLRRNPAFTPTPVPQQHQVDRHVIAKLNDLLIQPSDLASDEEFLRRVHLDLIGLQPSPGEILAFLEDSRPDKRMQVVESLFSRPEFVDHWSLKWGDLFQNSRVRLNEPAVYAFREWIRSAVASNMPVDEFARQILMSRGGPDDDPASGYFAASKDTNETLERVAQVFCGVRMLCARCHPHPMENWTQADYFGLHSFFNQVTVKNDPRLAGQPNPRAVLLQQTTGFSTNPRTGQPQPPRYLGGGEPALPPLTDRRVEFARWLTTPENPYFARSLANRYWSYFFHRGIIDPVDDLRTTNPPVNPDLLDELTADFVAHRFDVRHLMRTIVSSETYQRSSFANSTNQHDTMNFSHAIPRRVPAEALLDSLVQATGVRESFGGAPGNFSAAQLPDAEVTSEFLSLFGKPQRMEACECERDNESNMLQALHLINGQSILRRVADPNGKLMQLLAREASNDVVVEQLYLLTVCRRPTAREKELAQQHFQAYAADRPGAAQDLMWALLNSRDFLLIH